MNGDNAADDDLDDDDNYDDDDDEVQLPVANLGEGPQASSLFRVKKKI